MSLGPGSGAGGYGNSGSASNLKASTWKTRICNKWMLTGCCPFGSVIFLMDQKKPETLLLLIPSKGLYLPKLQLIRSSCLSLWCLILTVTISEFHHKGCPM